MFQRIVGTKDYVLENYVPFPHIELVHELVEQFDDIKYDLVNTHHQNILKIKNFIFMEKGVWYEIYSMIRNRSHKLEETVRKNTACLEE